MNDEVKRERERRIKEAEARAKVRDACKLIEAQSVVLRKLLIDCDDGSPDVALIAANFTVIQTWAQQVRKEPSERKGGF